MTERTTRLTLDAADLRVVLHAIEATYARPDRLTHDHLVAEGVHRRMSGALHRLDPDHPAPDPGSFSIPFHPAREDTRCIGQMGHECPEDRAGGPAGG